MPTISWSGSTSSPRREAKFVAVAIVSVSDTSMMPTAPTRSGPTSDHFVHGSAGTGTPWGRVPTVFPPRGLCRSISDGAAAAVVVMSVEAAERAGVRALAEIGTHGNVAGPDNSLHSQPSNAIRQALAKAGRTVSDLDLIEINEVSAIVAIQSMRDLNVGHDKVNVNGGAIALGHPLGAYGARIALHLCYELGRRGGGLGAAGMCGGGQGEALLRRRGGPTGPALRGVGTGRRRARGRACGFRAGCQCRPRPVAAPRRWR